MKTSLTIIFLCFSMMVSGQDNPMDLYYSGNSFFKSGNYNKAVENYSKLMEIVDEKSVQKTCFINRGLSYDRLQKFDLAIADFTQAIKLDSTDMASFIDRGLSYMHSGELENAIEDYNYVIWKNTNKKMAENAIYWLAQIHYSQGKFKEVIKFCDQFITRNPRDPEVHFIRGAANDMLRNFEQSILDYSEAIELKSDYTQAIANRGTAKINLLTGNGNLQPSRRQTRSACKDLKRAKELGDSTIEDLYFIYCERKE